MNFFKAITYLFIGVLASCGGKVKDQPSEADVSHEPRIPAYVLTLSGSENPVFSGYLNFDNYNNPEGGTGVLYPGNSGAGFIAAVLTHAAFSNSADKQRMKQFVEESNEVLTEFDGAIGSFTSAELRQRFFQGYRQDGGLNIIEAIPEGKRALGELQVQPEFILAEDASAILVETSFRLIKNNEVNARVANRRRGSRTAQPRSEETKVVVVGDTISDAPERYWNEEDGEPLKRYSSQLFEDSVTLYNRYLAEPASAEQRQQETVKYAAGNVLEIERGTVLEKSCNRMVFKSLRGWIKSVPIHPDYLPDRSDCSLVTSS